MMPATTLQTTRLVLRPPVLDDVEGWAALMADAESARFIGGVQPRTMAWRGLATMAGSWALQGFGMFSVIEKESGRWIGRVGPWRPAEWPGTEVGWGLLRSAWGKGYALEAAAATMDWACQALGWDEIIHVIDPENVRSRAVAQRLGSTLLRTARLPPPFDAGEVEIWGQDRAAWLARRGGSS